MALSMVTAELRVGERGVREGDDSDNPKVAFD